HRAQVDDAPDACRGRRLDHVARALDVHAAGVVERLPAPGAVEDRVAAGYRGRQGLRPRDVAVHALEADGPGAPGGTLADQRTDCHPVVQEAVDRARADEAVGPGDQGTSDLRGHAASLP